MADAIHEPIIIVGAARSGTGLLAGSIARHPDVAWIEEPNFIWKAYNADLGHDMIPAMRATEKVKRHIRDRFDAIRRADGDKPRIVEKTPQTAMRLPFVLEVFPDAKLVHVIRDGRQVVASARRKALGAVEKVTRRRGAAEQSGSLRNAAMLARVIRQKWREGIPFGDLLRYGPKAYNMGLGILGLKRSFAWGPEFPGMRRMVKTHPLVDVCALQWQVCVESVLNVLASRPDLEVHEVRFERLAAEPDQVTREVFDFAGLAQRTELRPLPPNHYDPAIDLFESELDAGERLLVYDRIGATLQRLGYWEPERTRRERSA